MNRFGSYEPDKNVKITENNNQIISFNGNDTNNKIGDIWNTNSFKTITEPMLNTVNLKMSWAQEIGENTKTEETPEPPLCSTPEEKMQEVVEEPHEEKEEESSPSHHARRPMNAFLIFCKKHRPVVRERFPNLENRGVTKILGEWWSLLDKNDRGPFINLANEYKDAFLSANPNFKWYKLPAPPLRTITSRPIATPLKEPTPPLATSPPPNVHDELKLTLGKLADESQLGSLSALLNNNTTQSNKDCCNGGHHHETPNNIGHNDEMESPVNLIKAQLPPKPIKKRINEQFTLLEGVARDLVKASEQNSELQQDDLNDLTRKSGRQCKGKKYEKFMVESKLLGNKRDAKLTQQKENEDSKKSNVSLTPSSMLENTIKRLSERTRADSEKSINADDNYNSETLPVTSASTESNSTTLQNSNFNLDLKISNLPNLCYETFTQLKRESKKRKMRPKPGPERVPKTNHNNNHIRKTDEGLVGSKKRKNKQSITHLNLSDDGEKGNDFLLGLATLAEVAANTEKLGDPT